MRNTQDLRGDNIIDSRDLIARRDYLAEGLAHEAEELRDIEAFLGEGTAEFEHGETLILDSYFEEYARELADDVCEVPKGGFRWPLTCIDWEKAARELQYDYTSAELGDYTYWFRNC